MRKITTLMIPLLLGPILAQAQEQGKAYEYLDVNQVKARIYNSADHFWDMDSRPSYEVPKGSGVHSNFAHSLWIGGHDTSGTAHVAANTYRQNGVDFYSGAYRQTHTYDVGVGFTTPFNAENRGIVPIDGGKVMVIYDSGFTVYDPTTHTTQVQTIPATRTRLQAFLLSNGKTMIFGDNTYPSIQDVFFADPGNSYSPQVSLQLNYYHRYSAAATLGNGKAILAGLTGTELYDPATNTSATTQAMPTAVNGAGSLVLPDGRFMVCGGATTYSNYSNGRTDIQLFDPNTNTWSLGPNMPTGRAFPLVLLKANGNVLIIGGSQTDADIYEYNPVASTVSTVGTLGLPYPYCSGGILPDGNVHFLAATTLAATVGKPMRYNVTTMQVTEEGYVMQGKESIVLGNGKVLTEFGSKNFREYDPSTRVFDEMRYQKVWKVSKAEITQFIADQANNTVNFANYPAIQTWPAHGNVAMGEDAYIAPFVDVNSDGLYRPLTQGDYPCILGDQALWWVFHDDGEHTESGGAKLGIQVKAMAYAYDCINNPCPDSSLKYTTFYHYEIANKENHEIADLRVGLWNDVDLGNYADDYIGCDISRQLGFVYNGDANDENPYGYGLNPPAFGSLLLGNTTMSTFMTYDNNFSGSGNPNAGTLGEDVYNYLSAHWKDGSAVVDNGLTGYDPQSTGPFTDYIFPGDPGFCGGTSTGWSEFSAGNTPFDRRMIQSYGPLNFTPNFELNMDYAMVWTRDPQANMFESVCTLQAASDAVRTFWDGLDKGCFDVVLSNPDRQSSKLGFTVYPNPASQGAHLSLTLPASNAKVTLRDLSGRLIQSQDLQDGSRIAELNLSGLPSGMYVVTLSGPEGSVSRKLSVQN
jgi:hypothetical protein